MNLWGIPLVEDVLDLCAIKSQLYRRVLKKEHVLLPSDSLSLLSDLSDLAQKRKYFSMSIFEPPFWLLNIQFW